MSRQRDKLVIAHDFTRQKYYPLGEPLPYEGRPDMLRDVLERLLPEVEIVLPLSRDDTTAALAGADFLVARRVWREWLEAAARLRWIQTQQAGLDHFVALSDITLADLAERGIVVTNAAGAATVAIGEQVLAYMLMFAREMHRCLRWQQERHFDPFTANELRGRTVGIVSLGTIGERVAKLCKCFEMEVIGTKRDPSGYRGAADEVIAFRGRRQVFERADYLVLCIGLADETRKMINAESLAWMKPTAYFINVARGLAVDQEALVDALKTGVIAGAGIDNHEPQVPQETEKDQERLHPESGLWELENVIITPNHASGTPRLYEYLGDIIANNHQRLAAGEEMINRVL